MIHARLPERHAALEINADCTGRFSHDQKKIEKKL
jgi:hypothetical protein